MYSQAIVTAGRLLSTTGDPLDRNAEYMRQASTITAPSRQTPM